MMKERSWVRGYRDGDDVCIEVRDNGLGMSEEILDSLLKRKQQSTKERFRCRRDQCT